MEDLKANYPANSVILYEDECDPLNSKAQLTKSWSPVGKPQKVEGNTPNVGSINLFGAYDYRTGEVFYKFTKKKNSYEFKRFLKRFLFRFKGRKIYLILDNARYHTSRDMQDWLAKQEGKIEFVFLPKQSPWLNPIEPVWEDFKNDRIRSQHFTSMRQIISESRDYFK